MLLKYFCILLQICALIQFGLGGLQTIPLASLLGFWSDMNWKTLCRQVCAIPNHAQSTEFTNQVVEASASVEIGQRIHLMQKLKSFIICDTFLCIFYYSSIKSLFTFYFSFFSFLVQRAVCKRTGTA